MHEIALADFDHSARAHTVLSSSLEMPSPSFSHGTPRKRAMSSSTPRPIILFSECSMPSTRRTARVDELGVVAVIGLVLVEDVAERIPVRGALHAKVQRVVGVADLVPVLLAGDGVGAGREHLVDRIEAPAEQSGLRAFAVERNAEREHLAARESALPGVDDVFRRHMVERADLVVLAPAAPVGQFFEASSIASGPTLIFIDTLSSRHFRCCSSVCGRPRGLRIQAEDRSVYRSIEAARKCVMTFLTMWNYLQVMTVCFGLRLTSFQEVSMRVAHGKR